MKYGICLQTSTAVRHAGSHRSEMTSQLLFGETFRVVEEDKGWVRIEGTLDNYFGWIEKIAATKLSERTFNKITAFPLCTLDIKPVSVALADGNSMHVLPGSTLPFFDPAQRMLTIEDRNFVLNQMPETGALKATHETVIKTALCFLNSPYLWGGRSLFGIDCSGFTQVVYKINHISIPRDAGQQVSEGTPVETVESAMPGDLAFFKDKKDKISHVGIMIENNRIIHASGHVKINKLDQTGIYDSENDNYTHILHSIRRYFA
ncbi:MAG: NlpC/P60 family protein [Bacteroidales bacterium]